MFNSLVEEYRGEILENVHRGRICIVNSEGTVIHGIGNTQQCTFYRSSSKPFQALPIIANNLDKKYNLANNEVTIMAGSHAGEDIHEAVLESLLEKTGFLESDLIMNPALPVEINRNKYFVKNGIMPRKLLHNCAGKHIALMLLSRELGGDIKTYWKLENPAQQEVLKYISYLCEYPIDKIGIGIDGCGVPVFAVPLRSIALSFMKLACPDRILDGNISRSAAHMADLIAENPYMMRGHGYICGEINVDSNIVAKGGAKGVYGFGLKKERLGIALKIEDGSEDTWPLIISSILRQLGYKNEKTFEMLEKLCPTYITNDNMMKVGEQRAVFTL